MPKNGVENVNASFSIFHQKDLILKLNRVVNFKNLTLIKASGVIKRLSFGMTVQAQFKILLFIIIYLEYIAQR